MSQLAHNRRGGPLAMLGLIMAAWISGRVMLWESPFGMAEALSKSVGTLLAEAPVGALPAPAILPQATPLAEFAMVETNTSRAPNPISAERLRPLTAEDLFVSGPGVAAGHQLLLMAAMGHLPLPRVVEEAWSKPKAPFALAQDAPGAGWSLPSDTKLGRESKTVADRWSVDAWAFWREGSNSSLISQGRVPVLGASQAGAILQYRIAPSSGRDPRAYLRGYRALVSNGESEGTLGVSARPLARVPLRLYAEARLTDAQSGTEVRGAAFAATELAPVKLPFGAQAELYAQGGYVGGNNSAAFFDGQLQVTREVANFDLAQSKSVRLSVGGGTWGGFQGAGAQDDVHRIDLGPTVRMDVSIGQVPARLSVDWRERVAGDAAPSSGVAATLSTRF